jgi:hypothetical protein
MLHCRHICSPATKHFSHPQQTMQPVVPLMEMPLQYKLVESVIMWTLSLINPLCCLGELPPKNMAKTYCFDQHIQILPSTQQLFINIYSTTCFNPNGPSSGAASLTHSIVAVTAEFVYVDCIHETGCKLKKKIYCFDFLLGFCMNYSHITCRFTYLSHPIPYTSHTTRSLLYS